MAKKGSFIFSETIIPPIMARYRHSGCASNGKSYLIGGTDTDNRIFSHIETIELRESNDGPPQTPDKLTFHQKIQFDGSNDFYDLFIHSISENFSLPITRHTSVVVNGKLWIFGGSNISSKMNELYLMDPETRNIVRVEPRSGVPPSSRSDHGCAAVGNKIFIFGGSDLSVTPQNDVHSFDTETLIWSELKTNGTVPSPRSGLVCVTLGKNIYLFGGAQWNQKKWTHKSNELFIFNTESLSWSKPNTEGPPPGVSTFAAAFPYGRHIWIIGGGSARGGFVCESISLFDTVSLNWTNPVIDGKRFNQKDCVSACVVDDKVILFGGFRGRPINELQILHMKWVKKFKQFDLSLDTDNYSEIIEK